MNDISRYCAFFNNLQFFLKTFEAMRTKMIWRTGLLILLVLGSTGQGCNTPTRHRIETSVREKLTMYPASTLQDLYKSYFQDYFGPGHLITDTVAARKYLEHEIGQEDYRDTLWLESTGYHGNFYRVNLVLIKNGTIPIDTFFRYFISSVNTVTGISMDRWKREWNIILDVIDGMDPDLPNYASDRQMIDSLLNTGDYVVHHSDLYIDTYHPHYRIIHRQLFEDHLRKYIDSTE
jgi:hypothetical protein